MFGKAKVSFESANNIVDRYASDIINRNEVCFGVFSFNFRLWSDYFWWERHKIWKSSKKYLGSIQCCRKCTKCIFLNERSILNTNIIIFIINLLFLWSAFYCWLFSPSPSPKTLPSTNPPTPQQNASTVLQHRSTSRLAANQINFWYISRAGVFAGETASPRPSNTATRDLLPIWEAAKITPFLDHSTLFPSSHQIPQWILFTHGIESSYRIAMALCTWGQNYTP